MIDIEGPEGPVTQIPENKLELIKMSDILTLRQWKQPVSQQITELRGQQNLLIAD